MGSSSGSVYSKRDCKDIVFYFSFFIHSYSAIYLYKREVDLDV